MSRLVNTVSPALDGAAVQIGDGSVRSRALRIPAGSYTPPIWLRTESGLVFRVDSLPWQGTVPVGDIEVLSSAPGSGLNEPAGMTTIYSNPGTSIDFATEGWSVGQDYPFDERMSLETGQNNPTGESTVIRIDHPLVASIDDETRGALAIQSWSDLVGVSIGNLSELYVRVRWKLNGDSVGGKFWYAGLSPEADLDAAGSNADYYVTQELNGGMTTDEQTVVLRRKVQFSSGGTASIQPGDTITGATSAATATVAAVDLTSGSWAGGDAAGWLWLHSKTGTFQAEGLNTAAQSNIASISGATSTAGPGGSMKRNGTEPLPDTGASWKSDWHVLEMHLAAESSAGARDGYGDYWIDDQLLDISSSSPWQGSPHTWNNAYWSEFGASESSFDGFRMLFCVNQQGTPRNFAHTIDWGEFYVSGKAI